MKNFPNQEYYTLTCLFLRKPNNKITIPPPLSNTPERLWRLHCFITILSFMRFVFFVSQQAILYRNKIKSPE